MQRRSTRSLGLAPTALVAALVVLALAMVSTTTHAAADGDTTSPAPFDLVTDASEYQSGFSVATPWTSVLVSWYLTSDDISPPQDIHYELAVDGAVQLTVQPQDSAGTFSKRVDVPDGQHTVSVTAVDAAGNSQSANQQLSVTVDRTDPTFAPGALLLMRRGYATADAIPMRFTWAAEDVGTGISHYRVGYGQTCCFEVGGSATSATFPIPTHSERMYRLTAYDGVGRSDRVLRLASIRPLAATELRFKGGWKTRPSAGSFSGLGETNSKTRGDRAVFDVQGGAFAWVATKGPKRGVADVYVDGRLVATVNLRSATPKPSHVVHVQRLTSERSHRVVIVNSSPRSRSGVGLDSILVQSPPRSL